MEKATWTVEGQSVIAAWSIVTDDTVTVNGPLKGVILAILENAATLTPRSNYENLEITQASGIGTATMTWNSGTLVDTGPDSVALMNAGYLDVCDDGTGGPWICDGWAIYAATGEPPTLFGYHVWDTPKTISEAGQEISFFPAFPFGPNP